MLEFFSGQALPPEIGSPHGAILWLSNGQKVGQLLIPSASLPVIVITPFATRGMHVARYYCSIIGNHFPVTIPKNLVEGFSCNRRDRKYACIHPGSGSLKKNYAPWLYRKIADELRQMGYPKVGFIFGPAERERGLLEKFAGEWILQPEDVENLADVLREVALYVGNDSGVTHLAAILGAPTIALYKTTDPKIWGALGKNVIHLCAGTEESALKQIQTQLHHRRAPRIER
jgi:ADP-heptose:LPS heptosyltransferase